jgi:hypothetical protein
MAQTKTKPRKRSTGNKSTGGSKKASASAKGRSTGSSAKKSKSTSSKAKSRSKSTSSKAKAKSSAAKSKSKAAKSKSSAAKSNGGGGRSALEKMKVPATVAGAAMLAAAGGLAASKNGSKGRGGKLGLPSAKAGLKSLKKIDLPKVDLSKVDLSKVDLPDPEEAIDWVEEKAKGVGDAGYRVAELSSQAQTLRKRFSGD